MPGKSVVAEQFISNVASRCALRDFVGFDIAPEQIALLSARTQSIFMEEAFPWW
jgi:hypothetical protein